jgi:hypothetical protein
MRAKSRALHLPHWIIEPWLAMKVRAKWRVDQRHLPLTGEHYELYDLLHRAYWRNLNDFPQLVECRHFNDRIQWLKLFDQSEDVVRCSDKLGVREFIRERAGQDYSVPIYQVCDRFREINFDALPDSFVIKTNHDSGTAVLVRDRKTFDRAAAETRIENSLRRSYGWKNGEWAYKFVRPRVLVEEFLEPAEPTPPPDYKFYVAEGRVRFLHYIYDRGPDSKEQTVNRAGQDMAIRLFPKFKYGHAFQKPDAWDEMIHLAELLGRGFKCVRVDLYYSNDRIYTGEMTFWPGAGYYPGDGQRQMGQLIDFDRTTYKPLVYQRLKAAAKLQKN